VKILAISGSLQAASSNSALLDAAVALAHEGTEVVRSISVGVLPHFNPDLEADGAETPAAVADLRAQTGEADGVLIATRSTPTACPVR